MKTKPDSARIYWIARHPNGRPFASFCGRNAKRDATRADARRKPLRMTGEQRDCLFPNAR